MSQVLAQPGHSLPSVSRICTHLPVVRPGVLAALALKSLDQLRDLLGGDGGEAVAELRRLFELAAGYGCDVCALCGSCTCGARSSALHCSAALALHTSRLSVAVSCLRWG
jgi:hypothetical protein